MQYPKNVKDIKNLNEFIRKAREFETDKYWSNILYDCSSANYADWTRRESRLKWKREMIQKYLNYKNRIEESKLEEKATIDWNNYLTPKEVKIFLSKDDKNESAEQIIYSKEFEPRYKDLHNPLQAKYKNSWTKKELVNDLADFYYQDNLITESDSNNLILYHNTLNTNAIKINKEGIIPGLRKDVYGKGSEAEGSGIWCSTKRGYGYGGATITFEIDKNDKALWKANDTEYVVYRDIKPDEIIDIDLVICTLSMNSERHDHINSTVESDIPALIKNWGKEELLEVFSRYPNHIPQPYNIEQIKHLIETGEKYCRGRIKMTESKQKIEEVVEIKYTPIVIDKLNKIRHKISSDIRAIEDKSELIKRIEDITDKCLKSGYRKQLKEFTRIDLENYQLKYNPTSDIRYNSWSYLLDLLNTTELNYDLIDFAQDYIISANVLYKYLTNNLTESKHKIEEKSRNELLAKTKSQTITRYNKAQEYKGFYIRGVDTDELLKKDSLLTINCQVGNYRDQVQMENMLYWVEYEIEERNHDLQVTSKYITQALMDAIDGMNIKVNCDCGDFCLEENTKIKLLNGEVVTVKQLKEKFDNKDELWVYSTDENGNFKPGKVNNVWISGQSKEMIKITLDNGEYIITTPNHKYMMRDTTYKQAQDLDIGDSLMPLYFQYTNGYENTKRNSIIYPTRFDSVYKTVANELLLDEINDAKSRTNEDVIVIHHKDFNKLNNYPSNLYPMGKLEHWYYHAHLGGKNLDKLIEAGRRFWKENPRRFEALEKQKNAAREYQLNMWKNFTPEEKEAYIQKSMGKADKEKLSQSHRRLWENYTEEEKQRRLKTNSFITNNPMKDPNFLNSNKMLERNRHAGESNHNYMQSLTKEERNNKYGTHKGIKESKETRLKKSESMKEYCRTHPNFHSCSKEHMYYMTELSLIPSHTKEANDKRSNTLKQNWLEKLNQVDEQTRKEMLLSKQLKNMDWHNIDIKYRITLGKAISVFKYLYLNNIDITKDNYISHKSSKAPKLSTIEDMIEDFETLVNISGFKYNHKVVNIEKIVYENSVDVYDIEVEKYHNFYVNAGVMLHNCYRMAYQATKFGYKYGTPETRPAKIRNPHDIGALCKHLTSLLSNKKWLQQVTSILMDFIVDNIDKVNQFLRRKPGQEFTVPNAEARRLGKQGSYKKFLNRNELLKNIANDFIKESEDKLFDINLNLDDDLERYVNNSEQYSWQKITPQEFKVIRELINNYIQENKPEESEKNNNLEDDSNETI